MYYLNVLYRCLLILISCDCLVKSEMYTAVTNLAELIDTHKKVTETISDYLTKERKRLQMFDWLVNNYRLHQKAMEDPNYVNNPINAFTLVKRLTVDVLPIQKLVNKTTAYKRNWDVTYPSAVDLAGAARAIAFLHLTYRLKVANLVNGTIGSFQSQPLTPSDCFAIGKELYKLHYFTNGINWMLEAHKLYDEENSIMLIDVLEHISFAYHKLGKEGLAFQWMRKAANLKSEDIKFDYLDYYDQRMEEMKSEYKRVKASKGTTKWINRYMDVCRGDLGVQSKKRLKCFLMDFHRPYLKIAPIKTEQLYDRPKIYLFHEIIKEKEMGIIKKATKPKLRTCSSDSSPTSIQRNICEVAYLKVVDLPVLRKILRRFTYFTKVKTFHNWEINNFGVGGEAFGATKSPHKQGKRLLASIRFFMSETKFGGATIFPELGVKVEQLKGAALFYNNLYTPAKQRTHYLADCPVLHGSKWTATQYIYED